MANLFLIGGPGVPAIEQVAILMFFVLAVLWMMNTLYNWLKKKPWKKKIIQSPPPSDASPPENGI